MTAIEDAYLFQVVTLTENQHDAIMTALTIASEKAIPYDAALYASAFEAMCLTTPPTDDEREALAQAEAEAERRWPIQPHGVTDTRDVPDLLRHRACFVQGATWAAGFRRQGPTGGEDDERANH